MKKLTKKSGFRNYLGSYFALGVLFTIFDVTLISNNLFLFKIVVALYFLIAGFIELHLECKENPHYVKENEKEFWLALIWYALGLGWWFVII